MLLLATVVTIAFGQKRTWWSSCQKISPIADFDVARVSLIQSVLISFIHDTFSIPERGTMLVGIQ